VREIGDANKQPIELKNGKTNLAPPVREIKNANMPPLVAEISWSKTL